MTPSLPAFLMLQSKLFLLVSDAQSINSVQSQHLRLSPCWYYRTVEPSQHLGTSSLPSSVPGTSPNLFAQSIEVFHRSRRQMLHADLFSLAPLKLPSISYRPLDLAARRIATLCLLTGGTEHFCLTLTLGVSLSLHLDSSCPRNLLCLRGSSNGLCPLRPPNGPSVRFGNCSSEHCGKVPSPGMSLS